MIGSSGAFQNITYIAIKCHNYWQSLLEQIQYIGTKVKQYLLCVIQHIGNKGVNIIIFKPYMEKYMVYKTHGGQIAVLNGKG